MGGDLMGAMDVMAYGYRVAVSINGVDMGVKGGKSESVRLFGTGHSMVSRLLKKMNRLACLKEGANEIRVDYERLKDEDSTGLTIEIKSEKQFATDEFAFRLREDPDVGDGPKSVTESFDM